MPLFRWQLWCFVSPQFWVAEVVILQKCLNSHEFSYPKIKT